MVPSGRPLVFHVLMAYDDGDEVAAARLPDQRLPASFFQRRASSRPTRN